MTDTRLVRLEQIAAGGFVFNEWVILAGMMALATDEVMDENGKPAPRILVRQIGDATGGDVFQPINRMEATLAEALRRAKWPHLVQVEVVNG